MEGPLSRVKSLKKSLRQSFRRIRKSRVSGKKRAPAASSKVSWGWQPSPCPGPEPSGLVRCRGPRGAHVKRATGAWTWGRKGSWKSVSERPWPSQLQEANAQLAEQTCPHDLEMTPVQRRIEPRSADDSLSGVVRCLYFADTFLRDGEARVGTSVLGGGGVRSTFCVLSYTLGHLGSQPPVNSLP